MPSSERSCQAAPFGFGSILIPVVVLGLTATAGHAEEESDVQPLKVLIALGPGKKPLAEFQKHLEANYHVTCRWMEAEKAKNDQPTPFSGIEELDECDVILSNLYRTWAPPEQLKTLKKNFRSKPVVGLRKAHHGFQNWLEADREVFGVDYRGHYFGKDVRMWIVEEHEEHPFFQKLDDAFLPAGGLYQHLEPAADVEVYMLGGPEDKRPMLQTWSRVVEERGGQRVFYTRYDPKDLAEPGVREMVIRALCWAAKRDFEKLRN